MIKRYLFTLGSLFLLVTCYLLTLLPLQVVRSDLSTATYVKALLVWGALVALSFLPAVSMIIKKIWLFHGRGTPIPETELRSALLTLNAMKIPVRIVEKRTRLVAGWRYDDPTWCEYMAFADISKVYEMRLSFSRENHTVTVSDRFRKVNFDLCPVRVKTGLLALPRPFFSLEKRKYPGIGQYEDMSPTDFHFTPTEIKSPLVNTILAHGWNVRFSLF